MPITRLQLEKWLDAYFAAWRSNEAAEVEALFAPDAVYSYGPFREPARGREQIVANWVADGAPLSAEFRYEILAVHGDTGIAHWNVRQKAYYFHEPRSSWTAPGAALRRGRAPHGAAAPWTLCHRTAATWTPTRPAIHRTNQSGHGPMRRSRGEGIPAGDEHQVQQHHVDRHADDEPRVEEQTSAEGARRPRRSRRARATRRPAPPGR